MIAGVLVFADHMSPTILYYYITNYTTIWMYYNYITYVGDSSYHTNNRQDKHGRRIGCKRPLEQEWNQIDEWQHTQP